MAKHRLTIEVDNSRLFDALKDAGPDRGPYNVGTRLAAVMLSGKTDDLREILGLGLYGISVMSIEPIETTEE